MLKSTLEKFSKKKVRLVHNKKNFYAEKKARNKAYLSTFRY